MKVCRGFFVVTCIFLLLFSFAKDDAQAACATDPVGIVGYPDTAPDIQTAYDHASFTLGLSDFTLRLAGQIFDENVILHGGAVKLDGGYACDLVNKADPPSPSSILGTITIRSSGALVSTVNTESPKVTATAQCAFDNDNDGPVLLEQPRQAAIEAARLGVERRYPDQAVDTVFRPQVAVGIWPFDQKGGAFDARLFPRLFVHDLDLETPLFAVPPVHPQQHVGPVAGLSAPRARVDGEIGVAGIERLAQQLLELDDHALAVARPRRAR